MSLCGSENRVARRWRGIAPSASTGCCAHFVNIDAGRGLLLFSLFSPYCSPWTSVASLSVYSSPRNKCLMSTARKIATRVLPYGIYKRGQRVSHASVSAHDPTITIRENRRHCSHVMCCTGSPVQIFHNGDGPERLATRFSVSAHCTISEAQFRRQCCSLLSLVQFQYDNDIIFADPQSQFHQFHAPHLNLFYI